MFYLPINFRRYFVFIHVTTKGHSGSFAVVNSQNLGLHSSAGMASKRKQKSHIRTDESLRNRQDMTF